MNPLDLLAAVGRGVIGACRTTGAIAVFAGAGVSHIVRPPFYGRMFLRAFVEFSYFSLPVVALTAIFSGMVIALQSYTGFSRFNAESAIAGVVALSVVRELGPVGTMRVTDQIDALGTLSTNPMKYLVAPRLLAGTLALPLLVMIADILGVMGGFIIAVVKLEFGAKGYLAATANLLTTVDVVSGLAKAAVFGFLIALMGCFHGYNSRGGAQGVGAAATAAVVVASILILSSDYVLTELFFAR